MHKLHESSHSRIPLGRGCGGKAETGRIGREREKEIRNPHQGREPGFRSGTGSRMIFRRCLAIFVVGLGISLAVMMGLPSRQKVICKVCHCGKEKCAAMCSEENMCVGRCNSECRRKK